MMAVECSREADLLEALASGRWPDRLGVDLDAHVAKCALCSDLGTVFHSIRRDRGAAMAAARIPSAGLVWWKAEIRARQEAIRAAARPINLVLPIAGACGIGTALGLLSRGSFLSEAAWISEMAGIWQDNPLPFYLLCAGAALVVLLTPVALYFVFSDD